jgi:3-oxocholest-4-en-26-oyl-CoA dehydrogenase alpha subunit
MIDFELELSQLRFLAGLRSFLDGADLDRWEGANESEALEGEADRSFFRALAEAGWQGIAWPPEYGGKGGSAVEQWLYLEELSHRRLPRGDLTISSIGPAIMRFGTEQQKRDYLPGILTGEIVFGVGYSEPEAGTDLASLRTSAVRDRDEWIINGQKVFVTSAHYSSHTWLAARTDPSAAKHRGISVLIVPIDAPGVTVRAMSTQADGVTNELFFDDVRVPASSIVGEPGQGWAIIREALDFERNFPYAGLARDFEDLLAWAATSDEPGADPPLADVALRERLNDLAADLEVARLLAMRVAWAVDAGLSPTVEASMSKVWTSELRERVAGVGLRAMGATGQLRAGSEGAPLDGSLEQIYRWTPMMKIGGGVNEIQREIIATRGLGLPRE